MPGTTGVAVLRRSGDDPGEKVVVVSAAADTRIKVRCLELGASDFVAKPFELAELVARVEARARRPIPADAVPGQRLLRVGRLELDLDRRTVDAGGGPVALPGKEFALLRHLMRARRRALLARGAARRGVGHAVRHGHERRGHLGAPPAAEAPSGRHRNAAKRRVPACRLNDDSTSAVAAFVVGCLGLMVLAPGFQTVPFHWIWIGLTLLAGVRLWSVRGTWAGRRRSSAGTTGAAMLVPGGAGQSAVEMSEIPLMAAVYLTMVWHARRRELALARVDRANEQQRDFVRDAAHGLRTPLTIARGHLDLVGERLPDGPERDDVAVALDELRRLSAMSDSLLLLSTADDPSFLSRTRLDVAPLLRDVAARWEAASRRPIGIDAEWLPHRRRRRGAPAMRARRARRERAPGDRGRGETSRSRPARRRRGSPSRWPTAVRGCPPMPAERIFDRFYRVDVESVRRGSGLGLPVVKAIAEAHGGSVSLESEPGRTVFAIHLPLAPGGVPRSAAAGRPMPVAARPSA